MNFGKKIKSLRPKKEITQEQLANQLNVSPQAVSKWENGVTIDELFDLTEQAHLERIENMLDTKYTISRREFDETAEFLKRTAGRSGAEWLCAGAYV